MFDPALAGYWGAADHMAGHEDGRRHHQRARRQGRRRQDLAARQGQGDRHAPPARQGRAHVYRRRLQLRRADRRRRRRATATRCSASSTPSRRRPPPRWRRWPPATARRFDDILAPTVPLSRHIFKAPTRFYKTGVVFMAYLNGLQDHFVMVGGQQSARSIAASGRAVPPRRPRRPAARSGARPPAHGRGAGRARDRLMRDFSSDLRHLSINTATVRKQLALARHHRGVRAARHPRHLSLARPGARRRPRGHRQADRRRFGIALSGYCRGGFFTAADAAGLRAALDDNRVRHRRGPHARRSLPGAGGGRAAGRACRQAGLQRHRAGARAGVRRHRRDARLRAAVSACRWPSSRCTPCRPPSAPASTRWSRRSTSAMRSTRGRPARSASRSTSITCGGTPSSRPDRARRGESACSPTTSATGWCRRATSSTTAA